MEKVQLSETKNPQPGIYEHFKSTAENSRQYIVFCTVKRKVLEADSLEPDEGIVVYATMYEIDGKTSPEFHWRSVTDFMEDVELEGGTKEIGRAHV